MDFMDDTLADGRTVRILTVLDVYARECVALVGVATFSGGDVARVLTAASTEPAPIRARQRIRFGEDCRPRSDRSDARPDTGSSSDSDSKFLPMRNQVRSCSGHRATPAFTDCSSTNLAARAPGLRMFPPSQIEMPFTRNLGACRMRSRTRSIPLKYSVLPVEFGDPISVMLLWNGSYR